MKASKFISKRKYENAFYVTGLNVWVNGLVAVFSMYLAPAISIIAAYLCGMSIRLLFVYKKSGGW